MAVSAHMLHCRTPNSSTMNRLSMHTVKQDTMHLLLTAMAYSILHMWSANCRNDNRVSGIKNKNDK